MSVEQRQNVVAWVIVGLCTWHLTGEWVAGVGAMALAFLYLRAHEQ